MDEPNVGAKPDPKDPEPRPPVEADLVALCRELNQRGARYVVVGGFAVISAGLPRVTGDIDLMVAADLVFLRYWFADRGESPPAV